MLALLLPSGVITTTAEVQPHVFDALSPANTTTFTPQVSWQWQRGGSFFDMDFPTGDTGWLGGELLVQGTKGPDGTWTWHQQAYEVTDQRYIYDLDFFDSHHGWALGSDNTILYTETGGATWQIFSLPDSLSGLNRVQMTGTQSGYAVGSNTAGEAVVLYSSDAGQSWQLLYSTGSTDYTFSDLSILPGGKGVAVGAHFGWAAGDGVIAQTDDDWETVQLSIVSERLWALATPTTDDFYAIGGHIGVGDPFLIASHSGGGSWQPVTLPAGFDRLDDLYFSSGMKGWVVGSDGYCAKMMWTTDAGDTWSVRDFCLAPVALEVLNDIASPDGQTLFAAQYGQGVFWPCTGGEGCAGIVIQSDDGGNTWSRIERLSSIWPNHLALSQDASAVTQGLIVGKIRGYPVSLRLRPDAWPAPEFTADTYYGGGWGGLDMATGTQAWATLADHYLHLGRIWHTTDAGESWVEQYCTESPPLAWGGGPVSAADANHIWAILYRPSNDSLYGEPFLFTTANGGETWVEKDTFSANLLAHPKKLVSLDGVHGVVLERQAVIVTSDGGDTGQYVSVYSYPGCERNRDLQMLNTQMGWLLCGPQYGGDSAVVKRTTDGGATWQQIATIDSNSTFLAFQDSQTGWAGGAQGIGDNLWETQDGGTTWHSVPDGIQPFPGWYGRVGFLDVTSAGRGWAAAESGTILQLGPSQSRALLTSQGGWLASPDGGRLLAQFPATSVSAGTEVTLQVYTPAAAGDYFAQGLYQLTLSPTVSLNQPITLTAQLAPAGTTTGLAAIQEEPRLAHWDGNTWVSLADSQYNPTTGEVSASAQETGFFAILVPAYKIYLPLIQR